MHWQDGCLDDVLGLVKPTAIAVNPRKSALEKVRTSTECRPSTMISTN
jgi:hypothetical protein